MSTTRAGMRSVIRAVLANLAGEFVECADVQEGRSDGVAIAADRGWLRHPETTPVVDTITFEQHNINQERREMNTNLPNHYEAKDERELLAWERWQTQSKKTLSLEEQRNRAFGEMVPLPLPIALEQSWSETLSLTEESLLEWLRELGELKTALNEHAQLAILDPAGKLLFVNDNFCRLARCTREELLGQDYQALAVNGKSQEDSAEMWATLHQGEIWRGELAHRAKDDTSYWVAATIVPALDADKTPCRFVAVSSDITAQKMCQEALAKSQLEIDQLKSRFHAEHDCVKGETMVNQGHSRILGRSLAIKRVLHKVEQVAPTDSVVLISGETGTGKELIAQEIHRLSRRRERSMVLVNCAALPSALVESELFGRERGAYTGALSSQVGRFEVANGSTIFLDEVGELSLEVQAKLLRVLQQGEFQRLGSPKNHKVDVRVIAATNRDLTKEVRKGTFREDLYYRLSVFPIQIPPLRERLEDIPILAFAFMEEFSSRMGKRIANMPRKAMETLQRHAWPGNIRELRNAIEHSVILSAGDTLRLSILGESPTREAQPVTLADVEREHIIRTLESTGWRIKGPYGAAVRLDIQPSTLYSRMQKLGIPHRRQKDAMPSLS